MNPLSLVRAGSRLRTRFYSLLCRWSFASYGHDTLIVPPARIAGEEHIAVGASCFIGPNSWLQVLNQERRPSNAVLRVGSHCKFSGFCTLSAVQSLTLEDSVLLARYVYIADHSHAISDRARPILDQGITKVAPVVIRSGAWIGQGAVICPGVTVGRGSVIGANSVVRDSVPDFTIAAGAPARCIRDV